VFCVAEIDLRFYFSIMVDRIQAVISNYQQRLINMAFAPTTSFPQ
jgi:hypothetical protein